jgi:hypothetical protein
VGTLNPRDAGAAALARSYCNNLLECSSPGGRRPQQLCAPSRPMPSMLPAFYGYLMRRAVKEIYPCNEPLGGHILLPLALAAVLSGCGGGVDDGENDNTPPAPHLLHLHLCPAPTRAAR